MSIDRIKKWLTARTMSTWFTVGFLALLAIGIGLAFGTWSSLHPDNRSVVSPIETIRNLGLVIGGVLAFLFAWWRAIVAGRQADAAKIQSDIALRTLSNERYQRGAEMLGSPVLAVRLGGIYALQQLAVEYPEQYHVQIMRLLSAFVRNPTRSVAEYPDGAPIPRLDVEDAMIAMGSRGERGRGIERADEFKLDLRGAFLSHIDIHDLDFTEADFQGVDLSYANMTRANFSGARLGGANLTRAILSSAVCVGSRFANAEMRRCDAMSADFSDACLREAELFSANLKKAKLRWANLNTANLLGADLACADISGTHFGVDHLPEDTDQAQIDQSYQHVNQEQLDSARADSNDPPNLGTSPGVEWRR